MSDVMPDPLATMLERLKLTAVRDRLDNLLDDASRREMTLRESLALLLESEIAHREERRMRMSTGIAKFPFVRTLEGFDFAAQPSLDPGQVRDLAACRWVANGDALLVLGPPGVGKTQVSIALPGSAPRGRRRGYDGLGDVIAGPGPVLMWGRSGHSAGTGPGRSGFRRP
jgi:DNA replication protein DnaC